MISYYSGQNQEQASCWDFIFLVYLHNWYVLKPFFHWKTGFIQKCPVLQTLRDIYPFWGWEVFDMTKQQTSVLAHILGQMLKIPTTNHKKSSQ